jgi:hypothetical protein
LMHKERNGRFVPFVFFSSWISSAHSYPNAVTNTNLPRYSKVEPHYSRSLRVHKVSLRRFSKYPSAHLNCAQNRTAHIVKMNDVYKFSSAVLDFAYFPIKFMFMSRNLLPCS